jgi:hypothetical protein
MATSVTQSLFGMTPQAIQAQRAAELEKQAMSFARLSPMESARQGLFYGVNQLGNALGQAMGYEDPEIAQAKQVQGLLGGADMNDPDALMQVAQRIQSINPAAAQELAQRALNMRKTKAEIEAKETEIQGKQAKLLQDQQSYQMRYEGLKAKDPNMSDALARSLADDPAAFREVMKSDKVVQETAEGVFIVDKNNPDNKVRIGSPVDRRNIQNVNVGGEEGAFIKELGTTQAQRLGAAYDKRDAAIRELNTFSQLSTLPDNQLISGTLAEPRIEMSKFLVTAGLASERDAQRVSSSEQFQKMSNDLVLARIKQLGHNPSNADLKFIEQTIPRLSNSPAARRELLAFMTKIANGVVEEVSNMEAYAMDKKTLSGYKPKVPQVSFEGGNTSGGQANMDGFRTTPSGVQYRLKGQ